MGTLVACSAQTLPSTNTEALREKLFQRFITNMESVITTTNRDQEYTNFMRKQFDDVVVDPTFGLDWDEVPAPTLTNAIAMDGVLGFVKTNGWNMATNDLFGEFTATHPMKAIRGLPWAAIKDRKFGAVTSDGIFYVVLKGWHHDLSGVAFNPKTNNFSGRLSGFKPIGGHWYVWVCGDYPMPLVQQYEGREPKINPNAGH
jgi:hypothetical protein